MGFWSLQHMRSSRSTCRGPKPARYVPSSGFGYPLDGLLPRIPCRFCFTPAALVGFTLRRFPLPEGLRSLSAGRNPHTIGPALFSAAKKRQTGLTGLGFWVHTSRKCLAAIRVFKPTTTGASHGVCPSRAYCKSLDPDFSGPPLTRFTGSGDYSPNPPAAQSIDQLSLRFTRTRTEVHAGQSNPYGVLAPARS
jgi:hypothetical protein